MAPKIFSFQDSAAYIYERAMKRRRDGKMIEALELLRKAVERDPQNSEYRLELAEMYAEMEMPVLSNRILLELALEPDAKPDCFYMLAVNDVCLGNEDNALRALEAYRKRTDEEHYAAAADEIYAALDDSLMPGARVPRKKARELRNAARVGEALAQSDASDVRAILDHIERSGQNSPETEAVLAMALTQINENEKAVASAAALERRQDAQAYELAIAAQVFWMCDMKDRAEAAIRRAVRLRPMDLSLIAVIKVLAQMDLRDELAEQCRLALQETPYNMHLIELRAAALHRSGAIAEAAACWKKILQMDPHNAAAAYRLHSIREGKNELPEYDHPLPEDAEREMRFDIAHILLTGKEIDEQKELSYADRAFTEGDVDLGLAAAAMLLQSDDPESIRMIREFFYRENISTQAVKNFREMATSRGKDPQRYFLPKELHPGTGLPPMREALVGLPAYERELIRYADDVLHADFGVSAGAELAQLWLDYIDREGGNRFNSIKEAAAALAWNYFLSVGVRPSVGELTEKFECAPRRMVYYAKHIAAVLEKSEDNENN